MFSKVRGEKCRDWEVGGWPPRKTATSPQLRREGLEDAAAAAEGTRYQVTDL